MSINARTLRTLGLASVLAVGIGGCVATGAGYDGGVDVGVSAGFYEPYGYDYGGWGPGYYVGPGRGGERRGGSARTHAYHPAPANRSPPTIPSRSRGGGTSGGNSRR